MTGPAAPSHPGTPPDPGAAWSARSRRRLVLTVIGLVTIVVGVVLVGPPSQDLPLDPRSAEDDGLLGLVRLMDELDVQVDIATDLPSDSETRIFVPADQMSSERRAELRRFAEDGGTVLVAGASPSIHGLTLEDSSILGAIGRTSRDPDCDPLGHVGEVMHDQWAPLEVPDGATACFPIDDGTAWLVVTQTGEGAIVALGSARPFTNALLAEQDNAVLAATLFGPEPGDRLVIVPRGAVGEGETPLLDLVPAGFLRALWLSACAVLVLVVWRARRLGPPVEERLPPVLPSAELARSVADLLQRAGDRAAAAGRLRDEIRREVRHALRVPLDTPSAHLVQLVVDHAGAFVDDARLALLDAPVEDDRALTELAAATARLRASLRHPTRTDPAASRP